MTADRDAIFKSVQRILSEILLVDVMAIEPETIQEDIENWDSMQQINVLLALEQSLGIQFAPEEFTSLDGVASIVDSIAEKQ